MKAGQFPNAINKLSALITANMPTINEQMALDATAMIKDRILNTGNSVNGSPLGAYSTNELPAFFFKDKALNQSGESFYLDAKKKNKGISYKEWREANNRPTDHVTLSFSGTTMKDVGVKKQIVNGAHVVTTVGAKNTKTRESGDSTEKIVDEYLGPKYGNFLQPDPSETDKLKKFLENKIKALIHESFK